MHVLPIASIPLVVFTLVAESGLSTELQPETVRAWEAYVAATEGRIERELASPTPFFAVDRLAASTRAGVRKDLSAGKVAMAQVHAPDLAGKSTDTPDGIVHHWIGLVRIPGASLDQVLAFVQRYDEHAKHYEDVTASRLISRDGDRFEVFLRLRRKKIVEVVYNTTHQVTYRRHDQTHASSRSVATRIAQVEDPKRPDGPEKPPGKDSGYLWRLNSYWRFQQEADGVIVECESISLSRDIPWILGWIRGIVEGISRESLERTLTSLRTATARKT